MLYRPLDVQPAQCPRCTMDLEGVFSLSVFTGEIICLICKEEERGAPGYERALKLKAKHVKRRNVEYIGVGFDAEDAEYIMLRRMRRADDGWTDQTRGHKNNVIVPVPLNALHARFRGFAERILMWHAPAESKVAREKAERVKAQVQASRNRISDERKLARALAQTEREFQTREATVQRTRALLTGVIATSERKNNDEAEAETDADR